MKTLLIFILALATLGNTAKPNACKIFSKNETWKACSTGDSTVYRHVDTNDGEWYTVAVIADSSLLWIAEDAAMFRGLKDNKDLKAFKWTVTDENFTDAMEIETSKDGKIKSLVFWTNDAE